MTTVFTLFFGCSMAMIWLDHILLFLFEAFCIGYMGFVVVTIPYIILRFVSVIFLCFKIGFSKVRLAKDYPPGRGLQVDVSVTTAMLVLGQLVGSLTISHLVKRYGISAISPYMAIMSFVAGVYCLFIVDYGDNEEEVTVEETISVLLSPNKSET